MKLNFKKILFFALFLIVYFLPSFIFRQDNEYYNSLEGNFVPPIVFIIAWTIIFLCLAFVNTYYLYYRNNFDKKEVKHYFVLTFINYIFIFLFPLAFFVMHNLFFSYIVTLLACMTAILMAMQSLLLKKKLTYFYIPYLLWTTFATVYSIMLYLQN